MNIKQIAEKLDDSYLPSFSEILSDFRIIDTYISSMPEDLITKLIKKAVFSIKFYKDKNGRIEPQFCSDNYHGSEIGYDEIHDLDKYKMSLPLPILEDNVRFAGYEVSFISKRFILWPEEGYNIVISNYFKNPKNRKKYELVKYLYLYESDKKIGPKHEFSDQDKFSIEIPLEEIYQLLNN